MTTDIMPSTHIIIVNYNAGDWLSKSLNSALAFSKGAVSVVDNASVDESVALAKEMLQASNSGALDRLRWIENTNNLGFAAANNQVLKDIDTDYAVLMNPDCEINQNTIDTIVQAFEHYPEMGLASCQILNQDGSVQTTCRRRFPTPASALIRLLQLDKLWPTKFSNFDYGDADIRAGSTEFVDAVSGAFMVVRKRALDDVGLLDQAYFMHCEDLDWCKRFELAGWKVGFVADSTVIHAKGVSSRSRPIRVLWTLHLGMNRFFDKFYRQQYPLWLRYTVKVGIAVSFFARSAGAAIKMLIGCFVRKAES